MAVALMGKIREVPIISVISLPTAHVHLSAVVLILEPHKVVYFYNLLVWDDVLLSTGMYPHHDFEAVTLPVLWLLSHAIIGSIDQVLCFRCHYICKVDQFVVHPQFYIGMYQFQFFTGQLVPIMWNSNMHSCIRLT